MTRRGQIVLFLAALAAPALASGARGEDLRLVGEDKQVWLVRTAEAEGVFDVAVRGVGGQWRWVRQAAPGDVAAVTATAGRLHVLLVGGGYLIFDPSGQATIGRRNEDWPGDAGAVAACAAPDSAAIPGGVILAFAPRTASPATGLAEAPATPSQPASRPAFRPGSRPAERGNLDVYENRNTEWRRLAPLLDVVLTATTNVFAAATDQAAYVCLADGPGRNRLAAWRDGAWRDIPLTVELAGSRILALVPAGNRLLAVFTAPGDRSERRELRLAALDEAAGTFASPAPPVSRDGKPATWAESAPPAVARLADHVALFWQEDGAARFALVAPGGGWLSAEDVDVFARPPSPGNGEKIVDYFVYAVLAATLLAMLVLRPRIAPQIFVLPPTLRPARLGRRLVAGVIDLLPFSLLAALIFPLPPLPTEDLSDFGQFLDLMAELARTETYALSVILTMSGYVLYGIVMEYRFGTTLGKKLFRLRVTGNGGLPPGLREVALRNLVKVVELMSLPLLLLFPLVNRNRQRLGDMFAQTAVVESTGVPPPPPVQDQTAAPSDDADKTGGGD